MRTHGKIGRLAAVLSALVLLAACTGDGDDGGDGDSGSTAAAAAGGSGGFCQGTKLVFFPGGTQGGGFETVVYNGARAAEKAFGPDVAYEWSDWDPSKMITQFQEAVA